MKTFNKLVRDKIPEIIKSKGEDCTTRILDEQEYLTALNTKLQEELKEYLESGDVEELADLQEVLLAIVKAKGVTFANFEALRQNKVDKRGAFDQRIFLETTF